MYMSVQKLSFSNREIAASFWETLPQCLVYCVAVQEWNTGGRPEHLVNSVAAGNLPRFYEIFKFLIREMGVTCRLTGIVVKLSEITCQEQGTVHTSYRFQVFIWNLRHDRTASWPGCPVRSITFLCSMVYGLLSSRKLCHFLRSPDMKPLPFGSQGGYQDNTFLFR